VVVFIFVFWTDLYVPDCDFGSQETAELVGWALRNFAGRSDQAGIQVLSATGVTAATAWSWLASGVAETQIVPVTIPYL
jgi:hypothetical protein